ncbi:MAG TPA: IPT/TIG domain-containing protein, partial [Pyrinomonadaceae bacterium]|nr:IPT/TIG domain-containing protein [Pyrinomonadaceae bacterium]
RGPLSTSTAPGVRVANNPKPEEVRNDPLSPLLPVAYSQTSPSIPEAQRNIFAYYTPPPKPSPTPNMEVPSPSPTPPPPLLLAGVSPANVYARTGDFTLEVSGDKFTPSTRIVINNSDLPTRFISAQQLSANVPAAMIAAEGPRQVFVRTPDGTLYSNTVNLNVMAPPVPNFIYVGILGGQRFNDTAILKDKNSRELLNVQRGDVVGGRYRVNSISEREVNLIDTSLQVKHTLPFTSDSGSNVPGAANPNTRANQPQPNYQPPPQKEPDEEEENLP